MQLLKDFNTFSVIATNALQCYSCISGLGSGCDDEFDSNGSGVEIIEKDLSGEPCMSCTKTKADGYGVKGVIFFYTFSYGNYMYFIDHHVKYKQLLLSIVPYRGNIIELLNRYSFYSSGIKFVMVVYVCFGFLGV